MGLATAASTTTGLALTMPSGMPLIQREWVAAGTAFNSALTQCTLPVLLGATALSSKQPFSRGAAIGCTGHVGGMVALVAAGEMAAVAFVICGVIRGVLMQVPATLVAALGSLRHVERGGRGTAPRMDWLTI